MIHIYLLYIRYRLPLIQAHLAVLYKESIQRAIIISNTDHIILVVTKPLLNMNL